MDLVRVKFSFQGNNFEKLWPTAHNDERNLADLTTFSQKKGIRESNHEMYDIPVYIVAIVAFVSLCLVPRTLPPPSKGKKENPGARISVRIKLKCM